MFKLKRPKRNQLGGYSVSELKTLLKRLGHKVPRNMADNGWVTEYNNRLYRWRWWNTEDDRGFVIDTSCEKEDFDRWSNSTELTDFFSTWLW